jgi:hypothetical protein
VAGETLRGAGRVDAESLDLIAVDRVGTKAAVGGADAQAEEEADHRLVAPRRWIAAHRPARGSPGSSASRRAGRALAVLAGRAGCPI